MAKIVESILDSIDTFFAWFQTSMHQTAGSYCDLQTADSPTVLVGHRGDLVTVLRIHGVIELIGQQEFERIQERMLSALQTTMSRPGHTLQFHFNYNKDEIGHEIAEILKPAKATSERLSLELNDLFGERVKFLSQYCAHESLYMVLWTRPDALTGEQLKRSRKEKRKQIKKDNIPAFKHTQNLIAAISDLRDVHDAFIRSVLNDMNSMGIRSDLLDVHEAVYQMRMTADPDFTSRDWRPLLPGDQLKFVKEPKKPTGEISDVLWPSLAQQILPRDAVNLDMRTVQIGDRIYSSVFIDLFPKDIREFIHLFRRTLPTQIPWRMSFLVDSNAMSSLKLKSALSAILSFSSPQNRLIHDATNLLNYIEVSTDDAVVKFRVTATTWAPEGDIRLLRSRASQLARAIEGWGSCSVTEFCGDAFGGVVSSMLGVSGSSMAPASIAPLSDVLFMLPLFRPSSPWETGAILFRSPDGKPWPYQPGSSQQTTWIDLMYARPGSGKSVLSNSINLALCLSAGLSRLPRIAIIDIGPSSSGLISLVKEALPAQQRHFAAYYRLRMTPEYSINPFDTQLGCRYPTPQERAFLVNFLTLLATPVGAEKTYDGVADMAGMIVDELYKSLADNGSPHVYTPGVEELIDGILEETGFVRDQHSTWWEVTDALFMAGFVHEAMLAQRHAMPVLGDVTSVSRLPAIEDLYGKIVAPTGETLIAAFSRMVSSAVREYPIISQVTRFDLGEARVVALDLDEVAKSGGDAANRQTAVMYMLARYVLARHFYLNEEDVKSMPTAYQSYHQVRVTEIKEDLKRIVFDEFHRTAKVQAVRDQVTVDMREGRKWKVQIGLISQSLDDFEEVMVEFATSVFIMDAGPEQAVQKTQKIFGLSDTGAIALRTRVHGPREGGATFIAQFATKYGMNTQLLTSTLGPVELWALSTTAEDVNIRNRLYRAIGPREARRVLAGIFPSGTAIKVVENRLADHKEKQGFIKDEVKSSIIEKLVQDILNAYAKDPNVKHLSE